jgi:hypothetical protein
MTPTGVLYVHTKTRPNNVAFFKDQQNSFRTNTQTKCNRESKTQSYFRTQPNELRRPFDHQTNFTANPEQMLVERKCMKLLTTLLLPIVAVGMASKALARDYKDLVAEGYRWVLLDGPYACPTKEDLRRITREQSDLNELHMVEQVRAYFLIQGALVKVIQEDGSTGMAEIRAAGIKIDLWTYNKFLSRRPIKNAYAAIETPETSGLIRTGTSVGMGAVQGATETPTPSLHTATGGVSKSRVVTAQPAPGFELGYR